MFVKKVSKPTEKEASSSTQTSQNSDSDFVLNRNSTKPIVIKDDATSKPDVDLKASTAASQKGTEKKSSLLSYSNASETMSSVGKKPKEDDNVCSSNNVKQSKLEAKTKLSNVSDLKKDVDETSKSNMKMITNEDEVSSSSDKQRKLAANPKLSAKGDVGKSKKPSSLAGIRFDGRNPSNGKDTGVKRPRTPKKKSNGKKYARITSFFSRKPGPPNSSKS